jgi:hypothetical protein
MFGISSYVASEAMFYITPQTLTIISGVLSALSGVVWFARHRGEDFTTGKSESELQVETI